MGARRARGRGGLWKCVLEVLRVVGYVLDVHAGSDGPRRGGVQPLPLATGASVPSAATPPSTTSAAPFVPLGNLRVRRKKVRRRRANTRKTRRKR
jgi:hypothetical protein